MARGGGGSGRLPANNGTVIFKSEVNHTFTNVTGLAVSVRKGQFGVIPEVEMLLGRFNGTLLPESTEEKDGSESQPAPHKAQFEACPQELQLRNLVPVPPKKAPKAAWTTPRHPSVTALLQEYHPSKHDAQSPDLLPELPMSPEVCRASYIISLLLLALHSQS